MLDQRLFGLIIICFVFYIVYLSCALSSVNSGIHNKQQIFIAKFPDNR